jgi:hypothetical protein
MVKTQYDIGDTVWIYGISVSNEKPWPGRIVHRFNIVFEGFDPTANHYVIAVDSHIEPLIEVRTWETISQDEHGPVGGIRGLGNTAERKILSRTGFDVGTTDSAEEFDRFEEHMFEDGDPSPDEIYAAMERSKQTAVLPPLVFKEFKKHKPRPAHRKRNKPQ